jgi:hypothetical protein
LKSLKRRIPPNIVLMLVLVLVLVSGLFRLSPSKIEDEHEHVNEHD